MPGVPRFGRKLPSAPDSVTLEVAEDLATGTRNSAVTTRRKGREKELIKGNRKDKLYPFVTMMTYLCCCLALALLVYYLAYSILPGLEENVALTERYCKVDKVVEAPKSLSEDEELNLAGKTPTFTCFLGEPPDIVRGYGVCLHVYVNYTVGQFLSRSRAPFTQREDQEGPKEWSEFSTPVPHITFENMVTAYQTSNQIQMSPEFYALFPTRETRPDELDGIFVPASEYISTVAESTSNMAIQGITPYGGCALWDCKLTADEARNASIIARNIFEIGAEFPCFAYTGAPDTKLVQVSYPNTDPLEPETRESLILKQKFKPDDTYSSLMTFSLYLGVSWMICYFLLCREWMCQFSWARNCQHF